MKETFLIILATVFASFIVLVIAAVIINFRNELSCKEYQEMTNIETLYSPIGGCYVKINGRHESFDVYKRNMTLSK